MIIEEVHLAAVTGNVSSQIELADMYFYGIEVPVSYSNAIKWYVKAALQGNSLATIKVGMMYEHGQGVMNDIYEAEIWYKKAKNITSSFYF